MIFSDNDLIRGNCVSKTTPVPCFKYVLHCLNTVCRPVDMKEGGKVLSTIVRKKSSMDRQNVKCQDDQKMTVSLS